jgi:hypothetical protein
LEWVFTGSVNPARLSVSLPQYQIDGDFPEGRYQANIVVHKSIISATFNIDFVINIQTFRNYAETSIRHLVDMEGYRIGIPLDVDLQFVRSANGLTHFFRVSCEEAMLADRRPLPIMHGEAADRLLRDRSIPPILADFREAMRRPVNTGFHSYRAIETMMQSVRPAGSSAADGWRRLRRVLRITRAPIDRIKPFADDLRHGNHPGIVGQDRQEILQLLDAIVERWMAFVAQNREALAEAQWPSLGGNPDW